MVFGLATYRSNKPSFLTNMSHDTYNKQWHQTQDFLNATLQLEPTQADRRQHRTLLATLYLRYIVVANRLAVCVDQMIQPQKRLLIRKLLEATLGRILELKMDLVEADLCEWTHCGDVLERLGLTPCDVELRVPSCFRRERREELEYRRWVVDAVLGKLGFLDRKEERPKMTEQQAILIIQVSLRLELSWWVLRDLYSFCWSWVALEQFVNKQYDSYKSEEH